MMEEGEGAPLNGSSGVNLKSVAWLKASGDSSQGQQTNSTSHPPVPMFSSHANISIRGIITNGLLIKIDHLDEFSLVIPINFSSGDSRLVLEKLSWILKNEN